MTENKPITRTFIIKGNSISKKIEVLVKLRFGPLAEAELSTLEAIVTYSFNNSLYITADIGEQIRLIFGITKSSFSTSLHRLEKKDIITRNGKTITLNFVFTGIVECEEMTIKFTKDDNKDS